MIEYEYESKFNDGTEKEINIAYSGGTFKNADINSEAVSIKEVLCADQALKYGGCVASTLTFETNAKRPSIKGNALTASFKIDGVVDLFQLGKYKVYSDELQTDEATRVVTAYDALYDVLSMDLTEWYNGLTFPLTIKQFRDALFEHLSIEQETTTLINDTFSISKKDVSGIKGSRILQDMCEANACFGHIGRDGKFKYIYLKPLVEPLFPSTELYPSESLYPSEGNAKQYDYVYSYKYEEYYAESISKLVVKQNNDDIGVVVGTGTNVYTINDNFFLTFDSEEEGQTVCQKIYNQISGISYRPFNVSVDGNPCVEVGDGISFSGETFVQSYVLERTLSGVHALSDSISANGVENMSEAVETTREAIESLNGKTNELVRTVDETKNTLTDRINGMQTEITATAAGLSVKVSKGEVIGEINASAELLKIDFGKINLNGYTSINNGFSIDIGGQASFKNSSVTVDLSGSGMFVTSNYNMYNYSSVTAGGITLSDSNQYGEITSKTLATIDATNKVMNIGQTTGCVLRCSEMYFGSRTLADYIKYIVQNM